MLNAASVFPFPEGVVDGPLYSLENFEHVGAHCDSCVGGGVMYKQHTRASSSVTFHFHFPNAPNPSSTHNTTAPPMMSIPIRRFGRIPGYVPAPPTQSRELTTEKSWIVAIFAGYTPPGLPGGAPREEPPDWPFTVPFDEAKAAAEEAGNTEDIATVMAVQYAAFAGALSPIHLASITQPPLAVEGQVEQCALHYHSKKVLFLARFMKTMYERPLLAPRVQTITFSMPFDTVVLSGDRKSVV